MTDYVQLFADALTERVLAEETEKYENAKAEYMNSCDTHPYDSVQEYAQYTFYLGRKKAVEDVIKLAEEYGLL